MKKLIMLLLLTGSVLAQEKVYNVQQYCVDEQPFAKGKCDLVGNEYSFVFLDEAKAKVVFFFTDMKLKYKILSTVKSELNPGEMVYQLEGDRGHAEMRIDKTRTKIEFIYPNTHIYLTVGNSTKLSSR